MDRLERPLITHQVVTGKEMKIRKVKSFNHSVIRLMNSLSRRELDYHTYSLENQSQSFKSSVVHLISK